MSPQNFIRDKADLQLTMAVLEPKNQPALLHFFSTWKWQPIPACQDSVPHFRQFHRHLTLIHPCLYQYLQQFSSKGTVLISGNRFIVIMLGLPTW